jgi:hypothetical protein
VVVDNNIVVGNGSFGLEIFNNQAGSAHAPVYFRHITSWGNLRDTNQSKQGAGEITINDAKNTQVTQSLEQTIAGTGLGGHPIYALALEGGDTSDAVSNDLADGVNGNNTMLYNVGSFTFVPGNLFGVSPGFNSPAVPGAPDCGGTASVTLCMAPVIANFTPTNSSAVGLGYQAPSSTPVSDALFPRWLCTANVPSGLITMGCE